MEAKWAKFFDLLGWLWEYEPFDCDGWVPDFAILGNEKHRRKQPVLVEVKPITSDSPAMREKIDRANKLHEVLLVGVSPIWESRGMYTIQIGWLREKWLIDEKETWTWAAALMGKWGGGIGFTHSEGSWSDRISGEYSGDDWCGVYYDDPQFRQKLQALWARAQNETQWNKK